MQLALRPCALGLVFWLACAQEDYAYEDDELLSEDSYAYDDAPVVTNLGGVFVNPGSSVICPSDCRFYFAGSHADDPLVCQKQGSGVGTAGQNERGGVACYPAYSCGPDMITCVNQNWGYPENPLPDTSNANEVCQEILALSSENPWECGDVQPWRTTSPCTQRPSMKGRWLKASASLGCGWGSTYGGVRPGYNGDPTPASVFQDWDAGTDGAWSEAQRATAEVRCCEAAMAFEHAPFSEGGAAVFFEVNQNGRCRIDREAIIFSNADSSSGYSVKFQDTRCGEDDDFFYYRHAAGAADAANLDSGGRCGTEFTRLDNENLGALPGSPLACLTCPRGELPNGWELPNHHCGTGTSFEDNEMGPRCSGAVKFNTINTAEDCCDMCRNLTWLGPDIGSDRSVDPVTKEFTNPCVAWQIVEGKCRILRKAYLDYHNSQHGSVLEAFRDTTYEYSVGHGNSGWMIAHRNCYEEGQAKPEFCNYFSYIHFREVAITPAVEPVVPDDYSYEADAYAYDCAQAEYVKMDVYDPGAAAENFTISAQVQVQGERRTQGRAAVLCPCMTWCREEYAGAAAAMCAHADCAGCSECSPTAAACGGPGSDASSGGASSGSCQERPDCARIVVYDPDAVRQIVDGSDNYTVLLPGAQPVTVSDCVAAGDVSVVVANTRRARRLAEGLAPGYVVGFTAAGSGRDTVDFVNAQAATGPSRPVPGGPAEDQDAPEDSADSSLDETADTPTEDGSDVNSVAGGVMTSGVILALLSSTTVL